MKQVKLGQNCNLVMDDAAEAPSKVERVAWSIRTLARAADLPVSTLYDLIRRGEGPSTRRLGRRIVVLATDAAAWLASLPAPTADKLRPP